MRVKAALLVPIILALCRSPAAGQDPTPVISDLRVAPSYGSPGSSYTISVRIDNPPSPEEIVPILYENRENMEKIEVKIHDDGLDGDEVKRDGRYTGRIEVPQTAAQETHHFKVYILDKAGRMSNVLEYQFTVVKDTVT